MPSNGGRKKKEKKKGKNMTGATVLHLIHAKEIQMDQHEVYITLSNMFVLL